MLMNDGIFFMHIENHHITKYCDFFRSLNYGGFYKKQVIKIGQK